MELAPILVVDEKPDMLTALSDALDGAGFPVEQAASGSEALDRFKAARYSLVITDEAAAFQACRCSIPSKKYLPRFP